MNKSLSVCFIVFFHCFFAYGKNSFFYYDKQKRVNILESLYKSMKINYSLWEIKTKRLKNFNSKKVFEQAIKKEKSIIDVTTDIGRAIANQNFLDRIRFLLAKFQDTHLQSHSSVPRPFIYNGIKLARIKGKYFVINKNKKILSFIKKNKDEINLGDRLLSIDGKSPDYYVDKYKKYHFSSSEQWAGEKAVKSLTDRNFLYPTKGKSKFRFESVKGNRIYESSLNYFYRDNKRVDNKVLFEYFSILSARRVNSVWNQRHQKWQKYRALPWQGYDYHKHAENYVPYATYLDIYKRSRVYELGFYIKNSKSYGVLKIISFKGKRLVNAQNNKKSLYFTPIRDFVLLLKRTKTNLIIDMRKNLGGKGRYPEKLLSILSSKNSKYLPSTWMLRITPRIRQMLEIVDSKKNKVGPTKDSRIALGAMREAIKQGKTHTSAFLRRGYIVADASVDGYKGKVVMLQSGGCVSSCDIFASLMKSSKRGVLFGLETNGTGAGARSNKFFDSVTWQDDYYSIKINIPNALFGVPADPLTLKKNNSYFDLNIENIPTQPDYYYESKYSDYFNNDKGWYDAAARVLESI
jgi:hypothetical protein